MAGNQRARAMESTRSKGSARVEEKPESAGRANWSLGTIYRRRRVIGSITYPIINPMQYTYEVTPGGMSPLRVYFGAR
eukprot:659864-Hanusia_phi.AAC.1